MNEATVKPKCPLVGSDGNVFAIIGLVTNTLKRAGQRDKANEFQNRAMGAGSYDEVLAMLFEYVDVTGQDEEDEEDDFFN